MVLDSYSPLAAANAFKHIRSLRGVGNEFDILLLFFINEMTRAGYLDI